MLTGAVPVERIWTMNAIHRRAYVAGAALHVRIEPDPDRTVLREAATTLGRTLFENLP
jgi:hypothetical protein